MRCQLVYSVVIFSHRFLDSDCMVCINFKTFAFLAVYWPFWTSLYSTDIPGLTSKFNNFLNRSSTILNNVFKISKRESIYAKIINLPVAKKWDFGVNSYLQVLSILPEEYCVLADIVHHCDNRTFLRNKNTWFWALVRFARSRILVNVSARTMHDKCYFLLFGNDDTSN